MESLSTFIPSLLCFVSEGKSTSREAGFLVDFIKTMLSCSLHQCDKRSKEDNPHKPHNARNPKP